MTVGPDTLSYPLAYRGTLRVALVMFVCQFAAVGILLVLAGVTRLALFPVRALRHMVAGRSLP